MNDEISEDIRRLIEKCKQFDDLEGIRIAAALSTILGAYEIGCQEKLSAVLYDFARKVSNEFNDTN